MGNERTKKKSLLEQKEAYIHERNKAEVSETDKEFRRKVKLAKLTYKVEEKLKVGKARDAW